MLFVCRQFVKLINLAIMNLNKLNLILLYSFVQNIQIVAREKNIFIY